MSSSHSEEANNTRSRVVREIEKLSSSQSQPRSLSSFFRFPFASLPYRSLLPPLSLHLSSLSSPRPRSIVHHRRFQVGPSAPHAPRNPLRPLPLSSCPPALAFWNQQHGHPRYHRHLLRPPFRAPNSTSPVERHLVPSGDSGRANRNQRPVLGPGHAELCVRCDLWRFRVPAGERGG